MAEEELEDIEDVQELWSFSKNRLKMTILKKL
jgi:hypothetical protein